MSATLELWPHGVQYDFLTSPERTRLFIGGLGSGKTLAGWIAALSLPPDAGLGLVIAPTYPMIRDVLLSSLDTHFRPFVESVNRTEHRVRLVNGIDLLLRSATDPDKMRGINAGWGWAEEACFIGAGAMTIWSSRIRVGGERRWVTTTPVKGSYIHRTYIEREQPGTAIFTCPSEANPHLSPTYIDEQRRLMSPKEAARELDAQWVDADGVLWDTEQLARDRVESAPPLTRYVIGVDPAVTSTRRSDRTGIILAGMGRDGHAYVLRDLSGQYAPHEWARVVHDLYSEHRAAGCLVVAEVNQGGDLVERNLRAVNPSIAYRAVRAARSKLDRAQPVATHYRMGRVHHVGYLRDLERQMTTWEPTDNESPDRVDALVWALTELSPMDRTGPAGIVERRTKQRIIA